MSASNNTPERGIGRLDVRAPRAVEIVVTNGPFTEVARGFDRVDKELPEGVYTVRWNSAGAVTQRVVRLQPSSEPLLLQYENKGEADEVLEIRTRMENAGVDNSRCSLMLIVYGSGGREANALSQDFALISGGARSQQGGRIEAFSSPIHGPAFVIGFSADPGSHTLKYKTVERLSVEQTVHVYPGRLTVCIMRLARVSRPEKAGKEVRFRTREGIDLSATRIFSVASNGNLQTLELHLRLVNTLLGMLAKGAGKLQESIYNAVETISDPYLRTYATAILLGPIGSGSTSLNLSLGREAAERAESLLRHPALYHIGCLPDTECAWWRLALAGRAEGRTPFGELKAAPMLDRCWQWAAAWNVKNPGSGGLLRLISVASTGRVPSLPWFIWRAAAKQVADRSTISDAELPELTDAARSLTDAIKSLGSQSPQRSSSSQAPKKSALLDVDLSMMSETTKRLAAQLNRLDVDAAGGLHLLEGLAVSMRAPMNVIAQHVKTALTEVQEVTSSWSRFDDPQYSTDPLKGKFGGSPTAGGMTLRLESWKPSNTKEVLALDIALICADSLPEPEGLVRFHLHPTFNPAIEIARWRGRRVGFTCYSMGGFTLGAETAQGDRLELDLSLDERLPEWFRSR